MFKYIIVFRNTTEKVVVQNNNTIKLICVCLANFLAQGRGLYVMEGGVAA